MSRTTASRSPGPQHSTAWSWTSSANREPGWGATSFQNGPIYWSVGSGAHPVVNHFFAAWQRNGREAGPLGYPTSDEIVNSDNIGRRQDFQGGTRCRRGAAERRLARKDRIYLHPIRAGGSDRARAGPDRSHQPERDRPHRTAAPLT
ncbi:MULTISPECIES: LGFP repeat-containing protein [unclassified Streptomyces]|uniref:LGFP repeat-containing protein n=1 Tax=unclassified Streptomyces TaxID=2593676 RepID=UPI00237A08D0|nr:hypothetical protein [Streptomyces sp. TSRI0281]